MSATFTKPLVLLTTAPQENEAQLLKACLEGIGIRCTVAHGTQLQVAPDDLAAAQEFLRSSAAAAEKAQPRKPPSPLSLWMRQIERGLMNVPWPLRFVLMILGAIYVAGSLAMFCRGALDKFSWLLS